MSATSRCVSNIRPVPQNRRTPISNIDFSQHETRDFELDRQTYAILEEAVRRAEQFEVINVSFRLWQNSIKVQNFVNNLLDRLAMALKKPFFPIKLQYKQPQLLIGES
jgi:2C-methyl-D-erythritol 2,4-cyclodiphosphate synthase